MPLDLSKISYAIREGHFELTPKYHVTHAIMINQIFHDQVFLDEVVDYLVDLLPNSQDITALVSTTHCGAALAYFAAAVLHRKHPDMAEVKLVSADIGLTGDRSVRRSSPQEPCLTPGDRCVIFHERALTGKILERLVTWSKSAQAEVIAIAVLGDRRAFQGPIRGIPVYSAYDLSHLGLNVDLESDTACPRCISGDPPLTSTVRVM